jgi:hypothetical protein
LAKVPGTVSAKSAKRNMSWELKRAGRKTGPFAN